MIRRSRMQGLTLVELMVAMVLGLVVIGGAVSLTLANRQSYRTNEGLSQVQESARSALELMARDIRQAGVTGCDNAGRISNVLDTSTINLWWMEWFGILGFEGDEASAVAFGTAARAERVADTDAIELQGIRDLALSLDTHDAGAATMDINAAATDIVPGDVIVACNFDHAAIFQVSNYDGATVRLTHDVSVGSPGNCSRGLGFPLDCTSPAGNQYEFTRNSQLGRFFATEWYVGQTLRTDDGGRSLFRRRVGSGSAEITEEVVAGVVDMQIRYLRDGTNGFVEADAVSAAQWEDVTAVQVDITVESQDARVSSDPGVSNGRLRRSFSQIVTLRNRVP